MRPADPVCSVVGAGPDPKQAAENGEAETLQLPPFVNAGEVPIK